MQFDESVIIQTFVSIATVLFSQLPVITGGGYGPTRTTTKGRVLGINEYVHGKKVEVFWGIPFAKPPVGELRFKHPLPTDPWIGVLNATERPNACIQAIDTKKHPGAEVWNANTNRSEDCLYLNVWVPDGTPSKAVMIWIFGGGFYSGSSALDIYDAKYIAAENDVVVVSMQYRVGPLGFLSLQHPENPSNSGLFDQVMALDWVQQNIHQFDGNAHSVTLFGESAGGASVGMHLLSPLSRGKFHRVIMQSGAPTAAWATLSDKEAKNRSLVLAEKMGCNTRTQDVVEIIQCLRVRNATDFPVKEWETIKFAPVRFPFVPTIDGAFLTDDPEKSIRKGDFKRCPILLGHNTNEANYWFLYYEPGIFPLNAPPQISETQFNVLADDFFRFHPYYPKLLNSFGKEAIKFQYRNWINPKNQKENALQLDMAVGDFNFICPCVDFALYAASFGNPVYYYTFEHRSSRHYWPEWTGVLHADEINFVFGEPTDSKFGYTDQEKKFSKKIMRYWTNFAKTGDPNKTPGTYESDEWPLFNNVTRKHLILDPKKLFNTVKTDAIGEGSRAKECSFWKDYLPNLIVRTADMSEMEVEWKLQFNEWSTKYIVEWKSQFDSFLWDNGLKQKKDCGTP